MKKLLLLILVCLVGCGPTAVQLAAEKEFYTAQREFIQQQKATPIFEIVASDPTKAIMMDNVAKIVVYAQPKDGEKLTQYQHKDYAQPWLNLTGQVLSIAVPWIGAAMIVNSVKDMVSNDTFNYNQTVSGQSTGTMRVGSTTPTSAIYGNSNTVTGYHEAVSDPTVVRPEVVFQPEPMVVNPVVVNPVVVQ